ncbi:MAG TPA: methyl-accepting chemotaxis protein [Holophagaceae bacterium]
MMSDFTHVRIRTKLLGLVLLPIVGGGLLSALQVAEQTRLVDRMQRLRAASSVSSAVGDVVQALQTESDDAALSLGAKGAEHRPDLLTAREETDQQIRFLQAAVDGTDAGLKALLPKPVMDLGLLHQLRQRGDRQGGGPELIEGYHHKVETLLQLEERLLLPAAGTPLEGRFRALAGLLRVKESAGLEQAILSAAISQGTLDLGQAERLSEAFEAQKVEEANFLSSAPASAQSGYRAALADPSYAPQFARLVDQAQAGQLGQDPAAWSRLASARLAAIKGVQDRLGLELMGDAAALEQGARTRGWLLLGGFSLFGLLVFAWTWRATMLITEPIQDLADGMARMERGDLRIQLPVRHADETGRMTQAFNAMSARLRELVQGLQGHAGRLGGGASALSASANQVSAATQQLAQSSRIQRGTSEEVASAVTQLQASVLQVQASLESMLDGGRSAGQQVRQTTQRAQAVLSALQEVVQRTEQAVQSIQVIQTLSQSGRQILEGPREADTALRLHQISVQSEKAAAQVSSLVEASRVALKAGAARVEEMVATMGSVDGALGEIELAAGEIQQAADDQAKVSSEVSRRMEASLAAAGAVQLAAAQLANTAPELAITARELVGVAQALESSAAAFEVA